MVSSGRGIAEPLLVVGGAPARCSRRAYLGASFMLAMALSGCSAGDDDPEDPAAETAEAALNSGNHASQVLTGPPVMGPVIWSTAVQPSTNEPTAPVTSFPDTAGVLYAVFPIERFPNGSTIDAAWTYNGTSLDGLDQQITASEDKVSGWLELHLERSNQDPWPDGQYALSLSAGGVLIAAAEVEVFES